MRIVLFTDQDLDAVPFPTTTGPATHVPTSPTRSGSW